MDAPRSHKTSQTSRPAQAVGRDAPTLAAIQEAIANIRFGVVQIIIQDGKIVQIDKTEKIRLI